MAIHFNECTVPAEPFGVGVTRQRLLTEARLKVTSILLDRWTLGPGAVAELEVPAGNLAWFQMLEGEAAFKRAEAEERLTDAHIVLLPPRCRGSLTSLAGAALLYAEVPDAGRFDPGFATHPPQLRVVDWKNEPVLDSQHDARKRIYVVTPRLFGTRAIKGEMIIYKTAWGKDEPVCTWAPSGRNIRGEKPVRDIKAHGGTDLISPQDV